MADSCFTDTLKTSLLAHTEDTDIKTQMTPSDIPRVPERLIGMPSSLLDIQSRTFATARRGYDRAEVDAFLKRLSETIAELLEERTVLSEDTVTDIAPESVAESTAILEDAETRASRRLHAATLEAGRLRTESRRTLDKAIKEAQEMENAARANAGQIINEATDRRQQILSDLLRRRKEAQTHVEMLRAARDELLNVFNQVRRITAQVKDPLDSALDRAKQAADAAAKRVQEEPQESLIQFEAELQTARLSGVIPAPAEAEAVAEAAQGADEVTEFSEQVATSETIDKPDSEEVKETIPISEPVDESEPAGPELDDIFARLRASTSQPEYQSESKPDLKQKPVESEQSSRLAKLGTKTAKSSKKRRAKKKATDSVQDSEAEVAESQDVQQEDAQAAQIEDLKRQIRRALTTDESKVLQAIHRLHNKAPKKVGELQTVLSSQDARTTEFAELLPVHPGHIQSLLVAPLSSSLAACDIAENDTKTLVQQVRDVYRSFSQEQIASAAFELVKHAGTAEETAVINAEQSRKPLD